MMVTSVNAVTPARDNDVVRVDESRLRYVSDEAGKAEAVVVPIDIWREISSQLETDYLMSNSVMRERILRDAQSTDTISFEDAIKMLGISQAEIDAVVLEEEEGAK